MAATINRDALIIFLKQPLIDWVNSVFDDDKLTCPDLMAHDQGNVYLFPETNYYKESIELLKESYMFFFEEELFGWCTDEKLWPNPLTWELFQEFFHYSIQSMVLDTLEEPLIRQEY